MVITKKKLDQWLAEHSTIVPDEMYNSLIETYGIEPGDGGRSRTFTSNCG